ncbi:MAG: UTP--glucose-1-phosphate uridylyltransferase [Campylobacterales bacterium]|nr:UTP--glucose-1-phosphate uridylyltransferase [Campylobacterales bacterium]
MSEIRYDRLSDTHVIIAPERLHRPDFMTVETPIIEKAICPFCEGNEFMTPKEILAMRKPDTIANQKGWQTRVVPNLYKAVAIETPHAHHDGNFEYWEGFGAHEVIIDTPRHSVSMGEWSHEEMVLWLKTLRARVGDLRRDRRIVFISLFKNEGYDAGSTMSHCHTQLIGLPMIPKTERSLYRQKRQYFEDNHHALMEAIVRAEEESGVRMIERSGEFSAFCPYASSYPFEVMISSQQCVGQIDTLRDNHIDDLALLLYRVIEKFQKELGRFSFNLSVSTPPLSDDSYGGEAHRLMIRIIPRIYRYGGFEVSTHMMINPVAPEVAAKRLRGEIND